MYEKEYELVKRQYDDMIEMIRTMTSMDRGSKYLPGIMQIADYMANQLQQMGCEITRHHDDIYGDTVVGRKKGKGKIKLLFFAHMDTVWPEGTVKERPFEIRENLAYGPGVSDCTPGLVSSLFLLRTLNELGEDRYGELIFLFTPDEELCSPSSGQWTQKYSKEADIAICMESPEDPGTFISSRAGSVYYNVYVKGKMAHAAINPEEGANALEELTYKMNDILAKKFPDVYLVVCQMSGGSGDCCVSDNGYAMLRYRIKSWDSAPQIAEFLKEEEQKTYVKGTTTSIEYWPENGFGPMPRLPWMDDIIKLVEKTSGEMGYPLKEGYSYGGCDASNAVLNCPTIDGMAPESVGCHSVGEYLCLDTLVPRTALLAVLVEKLSRDERYLKKSL